MHKDDWKRAVGLSLGGALLYASLYLTGDYLLHRYKTWIHGGVWCLETDTNGSSRIVYGQGCVVGKTLRDRKSANPSQ